MQPLNSNLGLQLAPTYLLHDGLKERYVLPTSFSCYQQQLHITLQNDICNAITTLKVTVGQTNFQWIILHVWKQFLDSTFFHLYIKLVEKDTMDLVNNYGSSDEEDNAQTSNVNSSSSVVKINAAPETGFDVSLPQE